MPRVVQPGSNGAGTAPTANWRKPTFSATASSAVSRRRRRRECRSARRGTSSSSARPRRRRVRAAAAATARRTCCRRRRARPRRAPISASGRDVDDLHQRVRRRLDPDDAVSARRRGVDRVEVGHVDGRRGGRPSARGAGRRAGGCRRRRRCPARCGRPGRAPRAAARPPQRARRRTRSRARPARARRPASRAPSWSGCRCARTRTRSADPPTPSCTKVELWWMGGVIAPVSGSGSWPAWMARVANPSSCSVGAERSVMMRSLRGRRLRRAGRAW